MIAMTALCCCVTIPLLSQTHLNQGDLAFLSVNSDNPDQFTILLLEPIEGGTEIRFTDNGFASPVGGRAGEGFLTLTAPVGGYARGTILTWTNGMVLDGTPWSSASPTNLAFNAAGDQLFAFQGNHTDWVSQNNIRLLAGMHYGQGTWITEGDAGASTSYLPEALNPQFTISFQEDNGYFANGQEVVAQVQLSASKQDLQTLLFNPEMWHKSNDLLTIPVFTVEVAASVVNNTPVLHNATTGVEWSLQEGVLTLTGVAAGSKIMVYNVHGQLQYTCITRDYITGINLGQSGLYYVSVNGSTFKVLRP